MSYGLPGPGEVIAGKYTIERQLGQGGMGAVFAVTHAVTGKRLALKCLLPEHASNADIVERFLREAQAAGRIQHRHVVDVFDVGREDSLLYIVMEYLEGKALADLLLDSNLTLTDALTIIVRAMEGVAAAHALGIVHRDLKPDNIFVCVGPSGNLDDPRVLDFGISKLGDNGINGNLTKTGATMGTPYYMSLEQMSGARDLDARVDVYAMGVILYEAIAGEPPHVAESLSALAIRVLTTEPTHLHALRPDLPPGLADVVMKAIARDRENRYPDVRALISAVQPFIARGTGMNVTGGKAQPLRTPKAVDVATDRTMPHAPSPASIKRVSQPAQDAWVPSRTTPEGRSSASLAAENARRTPSYVLAGAAALLLALAGAGAWLGLREKPVSEAPPPLPPSAATTAVSASVPEGATTTPPTTPPEAPPPQHAPSSPAPLLEPPSSVPDDSTTVQAGATEQGQRDVRPVKGHRRNDRANKPNQSSVPVPTAAKDPAPPAPAAPSPPVTPAKAASGVVQGRAGTIAPSDF